MNKKEILARELVELLDPPKHLCEGLVKKARGSSIEGLKIRIAQVKESNEKKD